MFKSVNLLYLFALALGTAHADLIPTLESVSGGGPYTWTYSLAVTLDQNAAMGVRPSANPVSPTDESVASFVTIYDFAGFVPGTCTGPVGWTCTAQNVGFTPSDVLPDDNPDIVNLTFARTSGPTVTGPATILLFTGNSIYNEITDVSFTSRGRRNSGPQAGTVIDNVGRTSGPTAGGAIQVPEPAGVFLLGSVLILAGRRLRRKTAPR